MTRRIHLPRRRCSRPAALLGGQRGLSTRTGRRVSAARIVLCALGAGPAARAAVRTRGLTPPGRSRAAIRRLMFAISGLGVGCYNSLQYLALQTSTAVNATLIGASAPVLYTDRRCRLFSSPVSAGNGSAPCCQRWACWWSSRAAIASTLLDLQLARGDLIMLVATLRGACTHGSCVRDDRPCR